LKVGHFQIVNGKAYLLNVAENISNRNALFDIAPNATTHQNDAYCKYMRRLLLGGMLQDLNVVRLSTTLLAWLSLKREYLLQR
jgi:hypothetical protein